VRKTSSPISRLPDVPVADANVVLSATIGGRARNVLLHPRAPTAMGPASAGDEVLEHLPHIARKCGLDLGVLLPVLAALPSSGSTQNGTFATRRKPDAGSKDVTRTTGRPSHWRSSSSHDTNRSRSGHKTRTSRSRASQP
jgi:hypothetical protein